MNMRLSRIFLGVLLSVLVCKAASGATPTSVANTNELETRLEGDRARLEQEGFVRWEWLKSGCVGCEIVMVGAAPELQSKEVQGFIATLADHKAELTRLYRIPDSEYNLLAQMAVGILGRESLFFTSRRYRFKEQFPQAVHLMKLLKIYWEGSNRTPSLNSRGPTQIKVIPRKIAERYGVKPETLYIPENAALATMGFLIEALAELKQRVVVNKLDYVNASNYVDYLPYLYFGSTKTLINGRANPANSNYIRDMKKYMQWVEIYERPLQVPLR